jgi:curli biogenesis system outer membrane secretion channel CsgG/Tfp pilus assembly protein PilF
MTERPTTMTNATNKTGMCTVGSVLAGDQRARWVRAALCALLTVAALAFPLPAFAADWGVRVQSAAKAAGAEVTSVVPETPAAAAGLQSGDVIVKVQGNAVRDADQFARAVGTAAPGMALTLQVSRQGWEKEVRLQPPVAAQSFGLAVRDPASGTGAEIASVVAGGAAAIAGLQPGDRVARAAGRPVVNAAGLAALIREAETRDGSLAVTMVRGDWTKEVTLLARPAVPVPADIAGPPRVPAAAAAAPVAGGDLAAAADEARRKYEAGNWREAEIQYRRVLELVPDEPRAWGRLCHVEVMLERFAEAVDTCQRAARLAPREPSVPQNIGYSLTRLARPADAIPWFQKAIDLAPDSPQSYVGIGGAQFTLRNWAKAEEYYRLAVDRDPGNVAAWQALGDAAGEQGKAADAIAAYRRALEAGAPNATLYRSLGWQLYRDGRLPDAERALVEANRLNPRDVSTLVSLGVVAEKLGNLSEAKQAWQRASELDPAGATGSIARQNLAALATQAPGGIPPAAPSGSVVERSGARPEPTPRAPVVAAPPVVPPRPAAGTPTARPAPPPGAQAGRLKVAIAVGDFQVKAAAAGQYIGDGLREMLVTALHGNGNFIVLERMDLKGLAAEQALSRSRMARPGEALPEGQMDVAEIMVYGAVTEFEPEVRGGGFNVGLGNIPLALGVQSKAAHMAIDMRVVDVASGRVLATGRVSGEAQSAQASIGANISARGTSIPVALGGFQNTPMEQAIRECIGGATAYVVNNTPPQYFRHP